MEVLVRKLTTEVSDLSDELVAVKNESHQTHLNDSPDKINTFLENAGAWNEKLDELFKDSQLQAQLVKDMAESYPDLKNIVEVNLAEALEKQIQRDKDLNQEMEGLRTDISKITIFEQIFSNMELAQQKISNRVTKLVTSTNTNLNNITERINKLEQGTKKHEPVRDLAKDIAVGQQLARLESSTDAKLKEPLAKLQKMEKVAECVEKHTEDIKRINDDLVTGIANVTGRVSQLEMNAPNQNLAKDMATFNQKLVSLEKEVRQ